MARFDVQSVADALAGTRYSGKIEHFLTIDSTNLRAVEAASADAPDGTVFVADEQTAGRGRSGHSWHSAAADGLYVSVIVRPRGSRIALSEALWLSLATGLAAQAAIKKTCGLDADLRWPNDLLLGGKKCGGILVETASFPGTPAHLRYAVIGIGINANHQEFPPELHDLATSLRIESGGSTSRESLLVDLLFALETEVDRLEAELEGTRPGGRLLDRFSAASSWVRGQRVQVDEDGGYTGVTIGLNREGFLLVAARDGSTRTVLSGGVREDRPSAGATPSDAIRSPQ